MRDNIQEVTIDREQMLVSSGSWFISEYNPQRITAKLVAREIAGCHDRHPKDRYKNASEILGMPAKRYAKIIRGMMHELWRSNKSFEPVINDYLFSGGSPSPYWMRKLYQNEKVVQQYLDDNLYNLVPIAIATGLNTQEGKKAFGKNAWKSLCNNSKSRNKLIMRAVGPTTLDTQAITKIKGCLVKTPSTLLKNLDFSCVDTELWAIHELRKTERLKDITHQKVNRLMNIYNDTWRMSQQLLLPFKETWSIRRMDEKHHEYTNAINARKYSDETIPWISEIPSKIVSKCGNYMANPLKSRLAIYNQGTSQRHCVGSYAESVARKEYLVYNISDRSGSTVSTLGIRVSDRYTFSQQYGLCNSRVSKGEELFTQEILKELNYGTK